MAETINIAKMAEKLSKEMFAEFLWQRMTPTNINWPCEDQDVHKVKTHPSDVVFYYDEPYTQARTYINTDLKSYGKGSITVGSIRSAIESLARSLSCAEKSEEFRTKFLHEHVSPDICGLLFVYNHDGEYDKDFSGLLGQVKNEKLDIPTKSKIVVFGPRDIFWLNNVHHEIAYMRGGGAILPDREHCKYFYPHLVRRKNVQLEHATAATLEMQARGLECGSRHLGLTWCDDSEDLGCFSGDAEQWLATHPTHHGHGAKLLLLTGHQADAETNLGHIDGREINRFLLRDRMNIGGAEPAAFDVDPQVGVNQEAHGLRSSLGVPRLDFLLVLIASASASAVSSSSVR